MCIDHAADQGFTGDGDEDSNPYPEEAKARDTKGPTSNFAEDNRVGHETEVEDSVHYSDVEIPKDAIWMQPRVSETIWFQYSWNPYQIGSETIMPNGLMRLIFNSSNRLILLSY